MSRTFERDLEWKRGRDVAAETLREMPIMPAASLGLFVAGGMFVDWTLATAWALAAFGSTACLGLACRRILKSSPQDRGAAFRMMVLACYAQTLVTAAYAPLLWRAGHGEWNLVLVIITMANAVFAASVTSPLRRIYAPIVVFYAIVTSVLCAWEAKPLFVTFSVLMPLFFLIVLASAFRGEMRLRTLLNMAHERDRLIEELQGANRAKNDFLSNMSHELRTPLNAILGFSEVMKDEIMGPIGNAAYRSYASDIHGSGRHLLGLVNDVLDLAQIEAGTLVPADESVRLAELVQRSLAGLTGDIGPAPMSMRVDVPSDICLRADPAMVERIIANVAANAVLDAAGGGDVSLRANRGEDGQIRLMVSDAGLGCADAAGREVAPFGHQRHDLADRYKSANLRLAIVKGLVALHEGTVALERREDGRTGLVISLPASRVVPPSDVRCAA